MFYKASRNQTIIRTGSIKPSVNFDQDDTSKVPQILKPPHSLHAWSAGPHEWGETLSLVDGVPPPVRWEHKSQHLPWHIKQRIYKADKKSLQVESPLWSPNKQYEMDDAEHWKRKESREKLRRRKKKRVRWTWTQKGKEETTRAEGSLKNSSAE